MENKIVDIDEVVEAAEDKVKSGEVNNGETERVFLWEEVTGIMLESKKYLDTLYNQILSLKNINSKIVDESEMLTAEFNGSENQCSDLLERVTYNLSKHSVKKDESYFPFTGEVNQQDADKYVSIILEYNNLISVITNAQYVLIPHLIGSLKALATDEVTLKELTTIEKLIGEQNE